MVVVMRSAIVASVVMVWGCSSGTARVAHPPVPVKTGPPVAPTAEPAGEREDFEGAPLGSMPPGWTLAGSAKGIAFTAAHGDAGTVLQIVTTGEGSGSIKHPLDVSRYRGKRIQIAARASCAKQMFLASGTVGVDVARAGARGYGDRVRTGRFDAAAWRDYQAIADVASDATGLDLVIGAGGAATIRIDDITVTVLGPAGAGDEPPRALEGRSLDNVVAFARLVGLVRYFHPSAEAAALDDAAWERFVVRGVRTVENAPDGSALQSRLEKLFAPIAPAVAIYPASAAGPTSPASPAMSGPPVHWTHVGLGISKESVYRSTRGAGDGVIHSTITTSIDPALVRGKDIKVTVRAHGKLAGENADAGLWIAEQRPDRKPGFYTEPEMQPAIGETWTEVAVAGRISADAASLVVGVQVIGDSEVWFEPPVVTAGGKVVAIPGWSSPGGALAPAWSGDTVTYSLAIGGPGCGRRRACLHLTPGPKPTLDLRPWTGALGGGVAGSVPLELATRDGKTVPEATASPPAPDPGPLLPGDRAARLAAVIIAWNVFEHFYPYFDVSATDWMQELPLRLAEAALDEDAAALHRTLRRMVHELHDGHGSVSHPGKDLSRIAPWLWEKVESKLVITQVADGCACDLAPGDVVTAIDGVRASQAIAGAGALLSAATEQFRTYQALRRLRAGPEGGRRTLTIERAGGVHSIEVALVEPVSAPVEKRPATGDEVAPGIRYVDVGHLSDDLWKKILPELAAATAIVFDVRGYPSNLPLASPLAHFTRTTVRSPQWHIPTPARPDREGMTFMKSSWTIDPVAPFLANVVFLTDGRAVSAAETWMGIIEHYKLGPIVGGPTAGTNGNINPFTLPGGYYVWWTGMKVLKHDGSRHHGVGIQPTVPAERTLAGVAARRDEVLEKGIEIAQQRSKAAPKKARANRGVRTP